MTKVKQSETAAPSAPASIADTDLDAAAGGKLTFTDLIVSSAKAVEKPEAKSFSWGVSQAGG